MNNYEARALEIFKRLEIAPTPEQVRELAVALIDERRSLCSTLAHEFACHLPEVNELTQSNTECLIFSLAGFKLSDGDPIPLMRKGDCNQPHGRESYHLREVTMFGRTRME